MSHSEGQLDRPSVGVHSLECASEAMGRLHHHRCHTLDLVTPTPGRVLFAQR
jgi:hypothetical protein